MTALDAGILKTSLAIFNNDVVAYAVAYTKTATDTIFLINNKHNVRLLIYKFFYITIKQRHPAGYPS